MQVTAGGASAAPRQMVPGGRACPNGSTWLWLKKTPARCRRYHGRAELR